MDNNSVNLKGVKIAFALTGSFCTFDVAIVQMENLCDLGAEIIPIMSDNAYSTDTRFGTAAEFREQIEKLCGREIIHTIAGAEPLGPKRMADILIVAPCTGNTMGKLAGGITDTAVVNQRNSRASRRINKGFAMWDVSAMKSSHKLVGRVIR